MKRLLFLTIFLAAAFTAFIATAGTSSAFEPVDYCGTPVLDVPDSGPSFNFAQACANHDACYANGGGILARSRCDQQFLREMNAWCDGAWSKTDPRYTQCKLVATTYYFGVRIGGWLYFFNNNPT